MWQATKQPFINAIFDREPLKQYVYGRIVLLGEAAHPTTPHGLRRCGIAQSCMFGACCTCVLCDLEQEQCCFGHAVSQATMKGLSNQLYCSTQLCQLYAEGCCRARLKLA